MTAYQTRALNTLAYVYIWFSHVSIPPSEEVRRRALWIELQDLLATAAAMGMYLDTPGEDLLMNVEGWAREKIAAVCGGSHLLCTHLADFFWMTGCLPSYAAFSRAWTAFPNVPARREWRGGACGAFFRCRIVGHAPPSCCG